MRMRRLFTLLAILFTIDINAQTQTITEADIRFRLPNEKWRLASSRNFDNPHVYTYKRAAIVDKSHREVVPNISFVIEDVPDTADIVVYSGYKREHLSLDVDDAFSYLSKPELLQHQYAIGFKGTYTDSRKLMHTLYYVIYIHKGKAINVICDVTSELFPKCKSEFDALIRSVENMSVYAYDGSLHQETVRFK